MPTTCSARPPASASFFFLTQYFQDVLHYSPVRTGFAFLPMSALIFTASRLIPRLLPRFGPKPLTLVGTVLLLSGLIGFTQVGAHSLLRPRPAVADGRDGPRHRAWPSAR